MNQSQKTTWRRCRRGGIVTKHALGGSIEVVPLTSAHPPRQQQCADEEETASKSG